MDKPTYVNGPEADAETVADFRDAAASDLDSVRAFAAEGCISGLIPDLSTSTVGVGEVIVGGQRARARATVSIDLAGVTRPASGQFRWVAITASYATTSSSDTLTELPSGVQYTAEVQDSIILALVEGVATTTGDSDDAVRPTAPVGTVNLCDLLIDHDTAYGSLPAANISDTRRTKCPHDRLQDQIDQLSATQDTIAATAEMAAAKPDKGPTPTATSTVSLRVDATWAAGTVPTNAPAITLTRLRWRQKGDGWSTSRTDTFSSVVLAHNFNVPDGDSDVEIQVAFGNSNGFGDWSNVGTIDAGNIVVDPPLQVRSFTMSGSHQYSWPYRTTLQVRLRITGADGGAGEDGEDGERGNNARRQTTTQYRAHCWYERPNGNRFTANSYFGGSQSGANNHSCPATYTFSDGSGPYDFVEKIISTIQVSTWVNGSRGNAGNAGVAGNAGGNSSVSVAGAPAIVTTGGAGGEGGEGGTGGAGGVGANGQGQTGSPGGTGEEGENGQIRVIDVTVAYGDVLDITVGAGGSGNPGGADGSVTVTPLT